MAQKKTTTENQTAEITSNTRPNDYKPQPGSKATLTLADFKDENLLAELRRRGYSGELLYTKTIIV